eukprot:641263-Pyramimonas_sp.AAC.1
MAVVDASETKSTIMLKTHAPRKKRDDFLPLGALPGASWPALRASGAVLGLPGGVPRPSSRSVELRRAVLR